MFQYDSWRVPTEVFLDRLTTSAKLAMVELVMVEDLPHGLTFRKDVKIVARLQGMIYQRFLDNKIEDKLRFCQPKVWQDHFREASWKVKSKAAKQKAITQTAHDLGYDPPNLHSELHGKERTQARKAETDYVDAYLIAKWTLDMIHSGIDFDTIASVSRYEPR